MVLPVFIFKVLFSCTACLVNARSPQTIRNEFEAGLKTRTKHSGHDQNNDFESGADFGELVKHRSFVDKTGLIGELCRFENGNGPHIWSAQAPKGFGKSAITSMLERFFQLNVDSKGNMVPNKSQTENFAIFSAISEHTGKYLRVFEQKNKAVFEKHFGEYPVVLFNLSAPVRWDGSEKRFARYLHGVLRTAFRKHRYLSRSDSLAEAMKNTIGVFLDAREANDMNDVHKMMADLFFSLKTHFGRKVVILVDDVDWPITESILSDNYSEADVHKLFRLLDNFLEMLLKFNKQNFEFAFLTETNRYCGSTYFSSNLRKSVFWHSKETPFGFKEDEVKELASRYGQAHKLDKFNEYFCGYKVAEESDMRLFNMISIIQSLRRNHIEPYWIESQFIKPLKSIFRFENLGRTFWDLMNFAEPPKISFAHTSEVLRPGDIIKIKKTLLAGSSQDFASNKRLILGYLFDNGFLSIDKGPDNCGRYVSLPNREVAEHFERWIWKAAIDRHNGLPQRVEEYIEALADLKNDTQPFVNKVALLVGYLGKATAESEVSAYLFCGVRELMRRNSQKCKVHLEVRLGERNNVYKDTESADLMFLRENSPSGGAKSYTGYIVKMKFKRGSAEEALDLILTQDHKFPFFYEEPFGGYHQPFCPSTNEDKFIRRNVENFVCIGLHVDASLKVTASFLIENNQMRESLARLEKPIPQVS